MGLQYNFTIAEHNYLLYDTIYVEYTGCEITKRLILGWIIKISFKRLYIMGEFFFLAYTDRSRLHEEIKNEGTIVYQ